MFNSLLIKRNKFTLIELIVVIGILTMLISLVMPNVKGVKEKTTIAAIVTNQNQVQVAVDMYKTTHTSDPIIGEEIVIGEPRTINMDKLYPNYIKNYPKIEGVSYWLDYSGKVWASLAELPTNVQNNAGKLTWTPGEKAVKYIVYEYLEIEGKTKYRRNKVRETVETEIIDVLDKEYLVQAVDKYGNKTPLVGKNYVKIDESINTEGIKIKYHKSGLYSENGEAFNSSVETLKLYYLRADTKNVKTINLSKEGDYFVGNLDIRSKHIAGIPYIYSEMLKEQIELNGFLLPLNSNLSETIFFTIEIPINPTIDKFEDEDKIITELFNNNIINNKKDDITEQVMFDLAGSPPFSTYALEEDVYELEFFISKTSNQEVNGNQKIVSTLNNGTDLYLYTKSNAVGFVPGLTEEPSTYWEDTVSSWPSNLDKTWDNGEENGITTDIPMTGEIVNRPVTEFDGINKLFVSDKIVTLGKRVFYLSGLEELVLGNNLIKIEEEAFYLNNIEELILPETIKEIGRQAFTGNDIKTLKLPNSLSVLKSRSFAQNSIKELEISSSLTLLDEYTFYNNDLDYVDLKNIEEIKENAFHENPIKAVTISNDVIIENGNALGIYGDSFKELYDLNEKKEGTYIYYNTTGWNYVGIAEYPTETGYSGGDWYHWVGPGVEQMTGQELANYTYPNASQWIPESNLIWEEVDNGIKILSYTGTNSDIIIPETINSLPVVNIDDSAFYNSNYTLNSVVIPKTIETIEDNAFRENELSSVIIGNSVSLIGSVSFYSNNLENVIIPDSVEIIDTDAFNANNMKRLTLGESVIEIGPQAFRNNLLEYVDFGESVRRIRGQAFQNNKITILELPDSVNIIYTSAFEDNDVAKIKIDDNVTVDHSPDTMGNNWGFKAAYYFLGAPSGTYQYNGSDWIKE